MKKLIAVLFASAMALCGCAAPTKFTTQSGTVQWHKGSLDQVQLECANHNIKARHIFNILGCYRIADNVCHIYSVDSPEQMSTLGHELKHCFDGHFHDSKHHWITQDDEDAAPPRPPNAPSRLTPK